MAAINGQTTEVIDISQGDVDVSKLPPNSIVLIDLSGQALVDLSREEVANLGGVCIKASGQADVNLDLSAVVATMFYYSRGGADTYLNFGESGTLRALATDVSGSSSLVIDGAKVACGGINYSSGGSALVTCNGINL